MNRNLKIVLERAHGATCEELAEKYGINKSRIHQIEVYMCQAHGLSTRLNPVQVGLAVQRHEAWFKGRSAEADTPESFYYEMKQDPRSYR